MRIAEVANIIIHLMCYDNSCCGGEYVYLTYNPNETILLDMIYTRKELSCQLLLTAWING